MKNQFLLNILLSFVWVALTGVFDYLNFLFGFLLSFAILWVISRSNADDRYFTMSFKIVSFFFFFLYELIKANIQVAYDVITPKLYMQPGIVCVPLDAKSDIEITLLANLISLTPGTLSLDVSSDKSALYVHAMYIRDKEAFISGIKNGFEKRLLSILR
jgi:multicomponent Na+:H+ antiporter subunit E